MDVNALFDLVSKEINKEKMVQNVKEIGKLWSAIRLKNN